MKYIKLFQTDSEYEEYLGGKVALPNVTHVVDAKSVSYTPKKHVVFVQHVNGTLYTPQQ